MFLWYSTNYSHNYFFLILLNILLWKSKKHHTFHGNKSKTWMQDVFVILSRDLRKIISFIIGAHILDKKPLFTFVNIFFTWVFAALLFHRMALFSHYLKSMISNWNESTFQHKISQICIATYGIIYNHYLEKIELCLVC